MKRRELLIEQGNVANDGVFLGKLFFTKSTIAAQPRLRNFHANAYSVTWSLPFLWLAGAN